jgi:hypothetical protein
MLSKFADQSLKPARLLEPELEQCWAGFPPMMMQPSMLAAAVAVMRLFRVSSCTVTKGNCSGYRSLAKHAALP